MSWQSTPLSDVCEIIMGQAPAGASYNEAGEGLALIAGAGDFGESTPKPKKYTTAASKISQVEDLILCIRATIGDLNWSDKEYCLGRGVAGLRPNNSSLDQNYLWHFIGSNKHQLSAKGTGSTFKQVSRSHIAEWEIPIPYPEDPEKSLKEQKRIAAILDKADAIRRKRQQAIQLADEFLRAVFLDMFGKGSEWKHVTVGESLDLINGRAFKSSEWGEEGLPIIRIQNLKNGNAESNFYSGKYDNKHYVEKGDILLSWAGQLVSFGVFCWDRSPGLLNQHIFNVKPKISFNSRYLEYALSFIVDKAKQNFSGIDMKHITKAELNKYDLAYPPIEEQEKFAEIVIQFEKAKNRSLVGLAESGQIFGSISQKAFAGDL